MTAQRFDIDPKSFGQKTQTAHHNLAETGLFTDEALIHLLDSFPPANLYVHAMLGPPSQMQWFTLDHRGRSGKELLTAAKNGKIWINVTGIQTIDSRYRILMSDLYRRLELSVPGLKILSTKATILISSPQAEVYYHADAPANLLWHIRGQKRLFVYPALDTRFASQDDLEKIFTRESHEGLPYSDSFDASATIVDLQPGEFVSWPHSSPHRVVNIANLNVSLSSEHYTAEILRREHIYCANRYFRGLFGKGFRSTNERGIWPAIKANSYRLIRKIGIHRYPYKTHKYLGRVDLTSPSGWSRLDRSA